MSERELRFSVDGLLLGEIGERLVTKNYIALAELIKNAYDADANKATIRFINVRDKKGLAGKSEIRIVDDGHGMNFNQINKFWMRIATPNKREHDISPRYGRKKTGSKGIGRFACSRLATHLVIESVGKREDDRGFDYTTIEFNWDEYVPGSTLTDIPNKCYTKIQEKGETGTTLRLIDLKDAWSETEFNVLRRQVLGLSIIPPIKREGFEEDLGFTVELDAPGFRKGIGMLKDQVMNAGWGRLTGEVSINGSAKLSLEAMKIGKIEYEFDEAFVDIPLVEFDIAIILSTTDYCRDSSTLKTYSINEIFENWSGVKVFLDGFRVYPFGDPKDDWLHIDEQQARRLGKIDPVFERICDNLVGVDKNRALLNLPRNQNLIGRVFLTNKPKQTFQVPINREGFIENKASNQLVTFLTKALHWATIYYNHFLHIIRSEKIEELAESLPEVSKVTEPVGAYEVEEVPRILDSALKIISEVSKDYTAKVPSKDRSDIGKHMKTAIDVVKESTLQMNRQISTLRAIASTGAIMFSFSHEARDIINKLGTAANKLDLLIKYVDKERVDEVQELSESMKKTRDRFIDQLKLFSGVSSNLSNVDKYKVKLKEFSKEVFDCYSGLIDEFSIKIENKIPASLLTGPMLKAEVYSILLNLISNAIKAVISGYGNNIKIEAFKNDDLVLRIYDDGIGIPDHLREKIVNVFTPDPENKQYRILSKRLGYEDFLTVGTGSGLGLNIVQEILRTYDKSFRFLKDEELRSPWKTCVEVLLPV